MKKIMISSILASSILLAEVTTVLPYAGNISYDKSNTKSLKDSAKFAGMYMSTGTLDYLIEFSYNYLDISYKDTLNIDNLKQHDFTLIYNKYFTNYMFKGGLHYINNNEDETFRDLGSGFIVIAGVGGYNWFNKNKLDYGIDAYYSSYGDAHNDISIARMTTVNVLQFTPYASYTIVSSDKMSNKLCAKANIISAGDYKESNYVSFEIEDTFTYDKFYASLSYLFGDMKSGVRNGGFTVFNTKDLYSSSLDMKVGYHFTPKLSLSANYAINNYEEYNAATLQLLPEGENTIAFLSLSYSF